MTLDKTLCMRCRTQNTWWNKHDDKRWEKGTVVCVLFNNGGYYDKITTSVKSRPPTHCLFCAEQCVTNQENADAGK